MVPTRKYSVCDSSHGTIPVFLRVCPPAVRDDDFQRLFQGFGDTSNHRTQERKTYFDMADSCQGGDLVSVLTCCPRLHAQAVENA